MGVQDLSISDLLDATRELWGGSTPGVWFRDHALARPFKDELSELREVLRRASLPGTEGARLIEALEAEDAQHDQYARYARGLLELTADHHSDPMIRQRAEQLSRVLFPGGTELTALDYEDAVERALARTAAMTPEVRLDLRSIPVPRTSESDPANLEAWMNLRLQASAMRVKMMLEASRRLVPSEGPTPMELMAAKHRFIVLVQQMLTTIRTVKSLEPHYRETLDRVREAWSRRVRDATARAEARRASPTPIWEPTL